MASRAPLLVFSAFNLAFGALMMMASGYLLDGGFVTTRLVVLLGFQLVGLQVGQTVGFQVAAGNDVSDTHSTRTLVWSVFAALLPLPFVWHLPEALEDFGPVLVTVMSVGFGLIHGIAGAKALLARGRLAFQRYLFWRNLSVGGALILAGGMFEDELRIVTAASVLCLLFALGVGRGTAVDDARVGSAGGNADHGYMSTMALGVLASLLYRNDVNIVRFALRDSDDFVALHYGLTLYSALVAFAGFFVSNFLYPKLHKARASLDPLIPKFLLLALVLVPPVLLALSSDEYSGVGIVLIPVVGLLGPIASAFIHSEGGSRFVYLTGATWFCLLLLSPVVLLDGGAGILNCFLGYLLIVALTLSIRLKPRAALT